MDRNRSFLGSIKLYVNLLLIVSSFVIVRGLVFTGERINEVTTATLGFLSGESALISSGLLSEPYDQRGSQLASTRYRLVKRSGDRFRRYIVLTGEGAGLIETQED